METATFSDPANNNHKQHSSAHPSLKQCFFHNGGEWFIKVNSESIGPFLDKADAQMALLYFNVKAFWPSDKQLRSFVRGQ